MIHETPSQKIFDEIRDASTELWKELYSDEFGYVTEKVSRIASLTNYQDNVMVCYRMFDHSNQGILRSRLSLDALDYIDNNN